MVDLRDVDPRLVQILAEAMDEWGPRRVYLAAAQLANVEIEEYNSEPIPSEWCGM